MVGPYRGVLSIPGAKGFVLAGFIGRMPASMLGIGVVLLISTLTGSYATAGGVSATVSLGYAVAAPLSGRLVDRFGQARILVPFVLLHGTALAGLMLCAHANAPVWTLYATGAAAGGTATSVGSMVRARWSHLVKDPVTVHTAFSFESVADEVIFVAGPALVSALATAVNTYAGLIVAIGLTVSGTLALAAQRGTQPPVVPRGERAGSPIAIPGVTLLSAVFVAVGAVFGSIDVITVAFATEHGRPGAAGLLLACVAGGSMVSGLWYGSRRWRVTLRSRFVRTLSLLAAGIAPVPLVNDIRPMPVALLTAGLFVSPTLITGFSLVERLVPTAQLTEGMAWIMTSIGFGAALGAWAGGRLTDMYGTSNAYAFSLACAVVAAVVGVAGSPLMRVEWPSAGPEAAGH